jgi:protein SCO1
MNKRFYSQAAGLLALGLVLILASECVQQTVAAQLLITPTVSAMDSMAHHMATPPPVKSAKIGYRGDLVEPPIQVQDFTLPSSTGNTQKLSDLNGRWRVIFFGYMHCPDICPLTLADFTLTKEALHTDAEQVEFIYISFDATRDEQQALADYLGNFDPSFIGFIADNATLARIQPDYGFYYSRRMDDSPQALLQVEHSGRSYLVDPQGYLVASFPYHLEPSVMAEALRWHIVNDNE